MSTTRSEVLLDRAGTLLMLVFGGYLVLGMATGNERLAISALLLANLIPATLMAMAAKAQGRSAIGFGLLAALGPLGGFYAWWRLNRSASHLRARAFAAIETQLPERYVDSDGVVHERRDDPR